MALFTRLLWDIRENFVLRRFGESLYFENPDIKAWLKAQAQADQPDLESWLRYIKTQILRDRLTEFREQQLEVLLANADPLPAIPDASTEDERMLEWFGNLKPLLKLLYSTGAKVYFGCRQGITVVSNKGGKLTAFSLHDTGMNHRHGLDFYNLSPLAVLDALLATWHRQGAKKAKARQTLCDLMAQRIAEVRTKAEHDFDQAIAVSDEGPDDLLYPSIVISRWVVVYGLTGPHQALIFETSRFWQRPFRLMGPYTRHRAITLQDKHAEVSTAWLANRGISALLDRPPFLETPQTIIVVWQVCGGFGPEKKEVGKIFVTPVTEFSGELPEGGLPIAMPRIDL